MGGFVESETSEFRGLALHLERERRCQDGVVISWQDAGLGKFSSLKTLSKTLRTDFEGTLLVKSRLRDAVLRSSALAEIDRKIRVVESLQLPSEELGKESDLDLVVRQEVGVELSKLTKLGEFDVTTIRSRSNPDLYRVLLLKEGEPRTEVWFSASGRNPEEIFRFNFPPFGFFKTTLNTDETVHFHASQEYLNAAIGLFVHGSRQVESGSFFNVADHALGNFNFPELLQIEKDNVGQEFNAALLQLGIVVTLPGRFYPNGLIVSEYVETARRVFDRVGEMSTDQAICALDNFYIRYLDRNSKHYDELYRLKWAIQYSGANKFLIRALNQVGNDYCNYASIVDCVWNMMDCGYLQNRIYPFDLENFRDRFGLAEMQTWYEFKEKGKPRKREDPDYQLAVMTAFFNSALEELPQTGHR